MDHQLRILELSAKIAGSAYFPMLVTSAGFSGQVIGVDDREFQDSWTLSLALKWDIFDWGAALQKKKQMLSQVRQLNTTKEELTKNMELAVRTGYLAVKDAFDNIAITRKSIEQSKRAYDITYDKFGQGLVPNSELLTAQSTKLQSEISITGLSVITIPNVLTLNISSPRNKDTERMVKMNRWLASSSFLKTCIAVSLLAAFYRDATGKRSRIRCQIRKNCASGESRGSKG